MNLALHSLAYPVTSLGPGQRLALWVAGCGRHCPGCISPEMQDAAAGRPVAIAILLERIVRLELPLQGITVSGGEPFDQAAALCELLGDIQAALPDWNSLVYTGYEISEIRTRGDAAARLLNLCDVLIAGPYRQKIPQVHPLAGSGNQTFHYLSPRGEALRTIIENTSPQPMNLGLGSGDGSFDMLIGVTGAESRRRVRDALDLMSG